MLLRGDESDLQFVFTSGQTRRKIENVQVSAAPGIRTKVALAKTIKVTKPSGAFDGGDSVMSEGVGDFPDRLVEFEDLEIQPRTSATLWVSLETDQSLAAGTYDAKVSWNENGASRSQTVKIEVLNSAFPAEPTFGNLAVVWNPDSPETLDLLTDHHLSPNSSYSKPYSPKKPVKYWGTKIWSNANVSSEQMDPPPSRERVGLRLLTVPKDTIPINYTADEIDGKQQLYAQVKAWGARLKEKGVKNLVVMTPDNQLLKPPLPVDVFVSMPKAFADDPGLMKRTNEAGAETWIYTATNQDPFSPKWLLDFSPANFRALCGVYAHQVGATGMVYWAVDKFTDNPLSDIAYQHPNGQPYHGDGILIYPDEKNPGAVVPSSRLKWIRDGILDYELLSRIAKQNPNTAKRISEYVMKSPTQWSQNPKDWLRFNEELRRSYASLFPSK